MKKLVGHGCWSESRIPPSVATSAIDDREQHGGRGSGGEPLRCGGRRDHEREHEQDADDLDRLGCRQREQQEDRDEQRADRHAARLRDVGIDAREEQRPVDDRRARRDDGGDDGERYAAGGRRRRRCFRRGGSSLRSRSPGRGRGRGRRGRARTRGRRRSRCRARARAARAMPSTSADEQRAGDHADHGVDSEHERGCGAGEAQLRDRVHGEAQAARDDEGADRARDDGDDCAGDQSGVDEVLAEQLVTSGMHSSRWWTCWSSGVPTTTTRPRTRRTSISVS